MTEQHDQTCAPAAEVALDHTTKVEPGSRGSPEDVAEAARQPDTTSNTEHCPPVSPEAAPAPVAEAELAPGEGATPADSDGSAGQARRWHAEAGRKGARRVQQLIEEGRLYEQEHGLKRGRQRLRQLLDLGKLYEQEHGLRPAPRKTRGERLARAEREELLATLLRCLLRIAKPSFRAELRRLAEALQRGEEGQAA